MRIAVCAAAALVVAACASSPPLPSPPPKPEAQAFLPPDVEAMSLLGKPLTAPELAPEVQKKREQELAQAQRDYDAHPESADAIIWT